MGSLHSRSEVYGLVLCGGKSTRMGKDKGSIKYHRLPQREHLYELMEKVCDSTFYSIRKDQVGELPNDSAIIFDDNEYKGPYNGILSAHKKFPKVAWMIMACDLPFMNEGSLRELLDARDPGSVATAFATEKGGLPEPLAGIWEPSGLKRSIEYLENGVSTCPRKFLINSNTKLVVPERDEVLLNANSREDYKTAISKLISN